MADYIYLLETRLSKSQQAALTAVRRIAREHELTIFLVGGAIRDLISGAPVRDLDVAVQGNALKLKKDVEKSGAEISSEVPALQALHVRFANGVRLEIGSTITTSFPKPGRVVAKPATILEDLRRRDFTANAMALSLNEGSYGLLMDPLNGVADIEDRQLRLVSNYGFIEDPVRLVRAARLMARLGWRMEEKTEARYATAKEENYIASMQPNEREYEIEELFHEEDPLRVMRRLEEEGWLQHLAPSLGVAKANTPELGRLRDLQMQLQEQGIIADASAANFPLLTAKMSPKEALSLRESFPRRVFVREIDTLDASAKEFATQLSSKQAALPSQTHALITSAPAVVVLWTAYTTKSAGLQAKFRSFVTEWPQAKQRIPYLLMQEMRITPELSRYEELLHSLSMALMDGALETPEAMRAFLEPYSPPAPPPPVNLRRPRVAKGAKKESRSSKSRKKPEDALELAPSGESAAAEDQPLVSRASETPRPELAEAEREPNGSPENPKTAKTTSRGATGATKTSVTKSTDTQSANLPGKPKTKAAGNAAASTRRAVPSSKPSTPGRKSLPVKNQPKTAIQKSARRAAKASSPKAVKARLSRPPAKKAAKSGTNSRSLAGRASKPAAKKPIVKKAVKPLRSSPKKPTGATTRAKKKIASNKRASKRA